MGITILTLSDFHCGNNTIPAETLKRHFEYYFINRISDDIDMVVINGDFYDRVLDMSSPYSYTSVQMINLLIVKCDIHNVKIRVVRGTYTHDIKQLQFFGADLHHHVKYIDTLKLEYVEDLDLYIMYIPDNLATLDLESDIKELLRVNHLDKVDIIFNHGYLSHLIPNNIKSVADKSLDSKFMSSICNILINGHIHEYSVYHNLISCGSFERLAHGYEGPKGFIELQYNKEKKHITHKLIENEMTALFLTFVGNNRGETELKAYINWLNSITLGDAFAIHISIHSPDNSLKSAFVNVTLEKFPDAKLKFKWLKECVAEDKELKIRYVPEVPLTEENLSKQLSIRLENIGETISEERIDQLLE